MKWSALTQLRHIDPTRTMLQAIAARVSDPRLRAILMRFATYTADGETFEPITLDGFGDPYATGVRSLLSTSEGLFVGTTTHRDVERLWRLRTRKGGRAGVGGLEIWRGA